MEEDRNGDLDAEIAARIVLEWTKPSPEQLDWLSPGVWAALRKTPEGREALANEIALLRAAMRRAGRAATEQSKEPMMTTHCTVLSVATILGEPADDLVIELGHDGEAVPGLPGVRRGYHVQELIDLFRRRGMACTPIEHDRPRFHDALVNSRGLIEGAYLGRPHMVAYDHGRIYDPKGYDYPVDDMAAYNFAPFCAWRVDEIQ